MPTQSSITDLQQRLDDLAARMDKAKNCVKGISCGSTCIPKGKTCKAKGGAAAAKLEQLVKAGPGGAPAGQAPAKKAAAKKASGSASPAPKAQPKQAATAAGEVAAAKPPAKAAAGVKMPSAKQIADQEQKVKDLEAKSKGAGGSKFFNQWVDAKLKLNDMKALAADPAAFAKKQADLAKREAERAARRSKWRVTQDKLDERQEAARSSLNRKDLQAIADYTADGGERSYDKVNACARKTPCKDRRAGQHIKELDAALKKLPANTDGDQFYRGVSVTDGEPTEKLYKMLEKATPGTVLKDPGYGSYSSDETVAEGFFFGERNIKFVSTSQALRPLNKFSEISSEYEALMPRGTPSTIRSVTKEGNTLIVELD
jgi:hypothetical protein